MIFTANKGPEAIKCRPLYCSTASNPLIGLAQRPLSQPEQCEVVRLYPETCLKLMPVIPESTIRFSSSDFAASFTKMLERVTASLNRLA